MVQTFISYAAINILKQEYYYNRKTIIGSGKNIKKLPPRTRNGKLLPMQLVSATDNI